MSTVNVRIDEKLKKQATKTFADLGLDMSSAIKIFLTQSVREKGLPFTPTRDDERIVRKWDREVAEAIASGKSYDTAEEMMRDILGKKYDKIQNSKD